MSDLSHPHVVLVALAIAIVGAALGLWLQRATTGPWKPWWLLAPALAIAAATLLRVALTSGIDSDESEHLHVSYLIGHGVLPYRDFDQNHTPTLWIFSAPLLQLLPETPYVLYLFRALALAAFASSLAIACMLTKQLSRGSGWLAPLCVFLALATAVNAEVYRFRADPFMNLAALVSLYFLLKRSGDPQRQAFWAGVAQGLAVALSPKLAHLTLLAPVLLLMRGRGGAWRSILGYGAGGLLALAPIFVWLAWHGLLDDAYVSIVGRNLGSATRRLAEVIPDLDPNIPPPTVYTRVFEPMRLLRLSPILVLTLVGVRQVLRQPSGEGSSALPLFAAWGLWLGVWGITPNTATYHIAGALILSAILGAHALDALASRSTRLAPLALGVLLSLCMASAPLRSGLGGWVNGHTYPLSRVAWLLDAVRSRGGGCLCLVPWHPIFIATPSPVYISNERFSARWGEALDWASERRPAAVMARRFQTMVERGMASQEQVDRITKLIQERYRLEHAGTAGFYLLKSRL